MTTIDLETLFDLLGAAQLEAVRRTTLRIRQQEWQARTAETLVLIEVDLEEWACRLKRTKERDRQQGSPVGENLPVPVEHRDAY